MVVGLVLEEKKPIFFLAVDLGLDLNGTSVYFIAFVEVVKLTGLLKVLCTDGGKVHKGYLLVLANVELSSLVKIVAVGFCDILVCDLSIGYLGEEGGMTAVVRPVGIDETKLGDSGIAMLGVTEVSLAELNIVIVHCKRILADEIAKALIVKTDKTVESSDGGGNIVVGLKRLGKLKCSLS